MDEHAPIFTTRVSFGVCSITDLHLVDTISTLLHWNFPISRIDEIMRATI